MEIWIDEVFSLNKLLPAGASVGPEKDPVNIGQRGMLACATKQEQVGRYGIVQTNGEKERNSILAGDESAQQIDWGKFEFAF